MCEKISEEQTTPSPHAYLLSFHPLQVTICPRLASAYSTHDERATTSRQVMTLRLAIVKATSHLKSRQPRTLVAEQNRVKSMKINSLQCGSCPRWVPTAAPALGRTSVHGSDNAPSLASGVLWSRSGCQRRGHREESRRRRRQPVLQSVRSGRPLRVFEFDLPRRVTWFAYQTG